MIDVCRDERSVAEIKRDELQQSFAQICREKEKIKEVTNKKWAAELERQLEEVRAKERGH